MVLFLKYCHIIYVCVVSTLWIHTRIHLHVLVALTVIVAILEKYSFSVQHPHTSGQQLLRVLEVPEGVNEGADLPLEGVALHQEEGDHPLEGVDQHQGVEDPHQGVADRPLEGVGQHQGVVDHPPVVGQDQVAVTQGIR